MFHKTLGNYRKYGLGASLAGLSGSAFSAVPAAVTTAIETGQADALSVGGLWLAAIIIIAALLLMRKGVR